MNAMTALCITILKLDKVSGEASRMQSNQTYEKEGTNYMFSPLTKQIQKSIRKGFAFFAAFALLFGVVLPANAQAIVSSTATTQLSYVVGESISVSGAPPTLAFAGAPLPQTGNLTIVTTWNLATGRTHLDTNLFFATPTAALTDGNGHNISSANVQANIAGGAFSSCNTNPAIEVAGVATAGGTCNVGFGVAITSGNLAGTHSDVFVLQLTAAGISGLPAGTYTGQLNVVAGAN